MSRFLFDLTIVLLLLVGDVSCAFLGARHPGKLTTGTAPAIEATRGTAAANLFGVGSGRDVPCQCESSSTSWASPAQRPPKCIFIDLGANDGETYKVFLGQSAKWTFHYDVGNFAHAQCDAYLVEANPSYHTALEAFRSDHVHPMVQVAAYMCDKPQETFHMAANAAGSSLNASHTNSSNSVPVQVQVQNLMRLLTEIALPEDTVVLKMDIEGAEYDILPCLANSPAAKLIDDFYVEDHCPPYGTAEWDPNWCPSTGSAGTTREEFQAALQTLRNKGVRVPDKYDSPMFVQQAEKAENKTTATEPAKKDQFQGILSDIMNKKHSIIHTTPAKIAVASQCGGDYYNCDEGTFTQSFRNHQDYAKKYGYEYFLLEKELSNRPKVWDRFPLVSLLHNRGAEWVLYLDADAIFMNMAINVETFIEGHGSTKDLLVSGDGNVHYQAGVYLMRNSQWNHQTMCKAWKVCPSPGWEELGAMMTVMGGGDPADSSTWYSSFDKLKGCGVTAHEQYAALQYLPEETQTHLSLLPQRAMDSYNPETVHAWPHVDPNDIQYQPGDWIIHIAGLQDKKLQIPRWAHEVQLANATNMDGHNSQACGPELLVPLSVFNCNDVAH